MKIYRKNVCVTMDLNEFHDILESNLFDELLLMIMELDEDSPSAIEAIYSDDYKPISHEVYEVDDMDSFMELLKDALDNDDVEYFYSQDMSGEDFVGFEGESWWIEEVEEQPKAKSKSGGKKPNKTDTRVKRILDKYKDIL